MAGIGSPPAKKSDGTVEYPELSPNSAYTPLLGLSLAQKFIPFSHLHYLSPYISWGIILTYTPPEVEAM